MEQKTIKTTIKAWLSSSYGPQDLQGNPTEVVRRLSFFSDGSGEKYWKEFGYVYVGDAEVTVNLIDVSAMVDSKVESLRAERKRVLADAQMKATEIEGKIQKLLAIGCDGIVA